MGTIEREFTKNGIREVFERSELHRLMALAAPMLEWLPTPGIPSFPYLNRAWVEARGWNLGLKVWVDAFGRDEQVWCDAAAVATSADVLVGVLPEPDLAHGQAYRVPLRPWPLNRFLSPNSLSAALLFPEDLSFVLYKDDGETLVVAGPAKFVQGVLPEGPETAESDYRAYAKRSTRDVTRSLLSDTVERYGSRQT